VYVKGKTIMTLNATNRMMYRQRMAIKNKYKKIIEPIIDKLERFDSGHIHLIFQVHFADRRLRDMDNQIFTVKWIQDALVEQGKLDDDKHVSYTFLPQINEPSLEEHYCEITAIDLGKNNYFQKIKEKNNE
jgi:hypothetical protein